MEELQKEVTEMTETLDPGTAKAVSETPSAEEMTPQDMADAFEVRAQTYGFLSRLLLKEVDEDLYNELITMHYPVESGNALMNDGYYHMAKYLSNEWVDPFTKLSIDFSACFLGGGIDAYSAAYPFESVYTSEKRLLMQGARDEVLAIYRSCGLDKASNWNVGEDHISVELEFMRIMIGRAIRALRAGNMEKAMQAVAVQQNFLNDHIRVWVPVFTADIRRFTKTLFYQGLAELLDGFLQSEAELLNDLIVEDEDEEAPTEPADNTEENTGEGEAAAAAPAGTEE